MIKLKILIQEIVPMKRLIHQHYSDTGNITDQLRYQLIVTKILSEKVNSKKINDELFSKDFGFCEKHGTNTYFQKYEMPA